MFSIGDIVKTHHGEIGAVVSEYEGDGYDWWVSLTFKSDGVEYTSKILYRQEQLSLWERRT